MSNPIHLIFPLLTAILFYWDYRNSTRNNGANFKKRALKEAILWSALYFMVGVANLSMFIRYD